MLLLVNQENILTAHPKKLEKIYIYKEIIKLCLVLWMILSCIQRTENSTLTQIPSQKREKMKRNAPWPHFMSHCNPESQTRQGQSNVTYKHRR